MTGCALFRVVQHMAPVGIFGKKKMVMEQIGLMEQKFAYASVTSPLSDVVTWLFTWQQAMTKSPLCACFPIRFRIWP